MWQLLTLEKILKLSCGSINSSIKIQFHFFFFYHARLQLKDCKWQLQVLSYMFSFVVTREMLVLIQVNINFHFRFPSEDFLLCLLTGFHHFFPPSFTEIFCWLITLTSVLSFSLSRNVAWSIFQRAELISSTQIFWVKLLIHSFSYPGPCHSFYPYSLLNTPSIL